MSERPSRLYRVRGRAGRQYLPAASLLACALLASGCEVLLPLRHPPPSPIEGAGPRGYGVPGVADELFGPVVALRFAEPRPVNVTTRDEALARFGRPDEIRASDIGPVLVYRRAVVVNVNPNRYYGEDRDDRFNRYERVLLQIDSEGRVVRWDVEPE